MAETRILEFIHDEKLQYSVSRRTERQSGFNRRFEFSWLFARSCRVVCEHAKVIFMILNKICHLRTRS